MTLYRQPDPTALQRRIDELERELESMRRPRALVASGAVTHADEMRSLAVRVRQGEPVAPDEALARIKRVADSGGMYTWFNRSDNGAVGLATLKRHLVAMGYRCSYDLDNDLRVSWELPWWSRLAAWWRNRR